MVQLGCHAGIQDRHLLSGRARAARVHRGPAPRCIGLPFAECALSQARGAGVLHGRRLAQPFDHGDGVGGGTPPDHLPGFDADRYRANYFRLVELLTDELAGFETVITHNPWGSTDTKTTCRCIVQSVRCHRRSGWTCGTRTTAATGPTL